MTAEERIAQLEAELAAAKSTHQCFTLLELHSIGGKHALVTLDEVSL